MLNPNGVALIFHFYVDRISILLESGDVVVFLNHGVANETRPDDMIGKKLGLVFEEAVCHEHGHKVNPHISWCCSEEEPVVVGSNPPEGMDPLTLTYQLLLVEDEERVLILILP